MAILFQDNYLHCPHCGSFCMTEESTNRYSPHPKDKTTLVKESIATWIKCAKCGTLVKEIVPNRDKIINLT